MSVVLFDLTALAVAGAVGLKLDLTIPIMPESPGGPDLRVTYA